MEVQAAAALEQEGRLAEAEAAFEALLAEGKGQTQARLGLARLAASRGAHADALAFLEAILAREPGHVAALAGRAAALRGARRMAEAEAAHLAVLRVAPAHPRASLGLGEMLLGRGAAEAALQPLRDAALGSGTRPASLRRQAEALRLLGRPAAAREALDTLLREQPGDKAARLLRAKLCREQGEWPAARSDLQAILAQGPHEAAAIELGLTERAAGEGAAAQAAFAAARAAAPGSARPVLELAMEARAQGDIATFEALVVQALRLGGTDPGVVCRIADQALAAGMPEVALSLVEAAQLRGAHAPALELRACDAMVRLGAAEAAIARLDALAARAGELPELRQRRIAALHTARPPRAALAYARESCVAAPGHFEIWRQRVRLEQRISPADELQAALDSMPAGCAAEQATGLRLRGQAALRAFRLEEAADSLARAAALAPRDAGICEDRLLAALLGMDLDAAAHLHAQHAALMRPQRLMTGQATAPLADFFGHLLRAFLDDPARDDLRRLAPQVPAARAAALRALCRGTPESTAAATMLALAWRQAGSFVGRAESSGQAITGPIVQYWDKTDIPPDVRALMASFPLQNPARRHQVFDDARARAYLAATHAPEVLAAYDAAEEAAQKSDVFRLAFLAVEGGIYADADDLCTAPLETLLGGACFVACQERYGTIANNFLACVPQHPVILAALDGAVAAVKRETRGMIWLETGPGLLTRALAGVVSRATLAPASWFAQCRILLPWERERAVSAHRFALYKRGAAHWHHAAFGRRAPRFAPVEKDVLF